MNHLILLRCSAALIFVAAAFTFFSISAPAVMAFDGKAAGFGASVTETVTPGTSNPFISVEDGQFIKNGEPWYFVGTNFWYGMHLGADNEYADRERLVRELDMLADLGMNNLRVLASSEGPDDGKWRVLPSLMPKPGIYNEDILVGLDFLLAEMAKRDMYAVLVLNNFFQWSGGMAQYVSWVTGEPIPYPHDEPNTWTDYQTFSARFYTLPEARRIYKDFLEMLLARVNTITGVAYIDDPVIKSWQLANEPRVFGFEEEYADWVRSASAFIKERAPRQLVSLGGEGKLPYEDAGMQFEELGAEESLDYLTIHLWIENWQRYDPYRPEETFHAASGFAMGYVADHIAISERLNKPMVLEEFGVSRDTKNYHPSAPVTYRDTFFTMIFEMLLHLSMRESTFAGLNLWSWSGESYPEFPMEYWELGKPLTGDPPHEEQGWYGIYEHDTSTHELIRQYNELLGNLK